MQGYLHIGNVIIVISSVHQEITAIVGSRLKQPPVKARFLQEKVKTSMAKTKIREKTKANPWVRARIKT